MTGNSADDPYFDIDVVCLKLDREALKRADDSLDPEERLKWLQIANAVRERCKTRVEEANAGLEFRYSRTRLLATTMVPLLSVLITGTALVFQAWQFNKTNANQADQFLRASVNGANQSEDEKWRDSMKSVSLSDPKASVIGAFAMQAFFKSPRYGEESRAMA